MKTLIFTGQPERIKAFIEALSTTDVKIDKRTETTCTVSCQSSNASALLSVAEKFSDLSWKPVLLKHLDSASAIAGWLG